MDFTALQKRTGLTGIELARRLGVSAGHVADLRSGRRTVTVQLAAKLEEVTGVAGLVDQVVQAKIGEAA